MVEKTYHDNGATFGTYYKSEENFESKQGVCYSPELSDEEYTYSDYLEMAEGYFEEKGYKGKPVILARQMFAFSEWQSPETLLNEWENMGEFDDYPEEHGIGV
jgi:hypothetical protein